MVVINRLFGVFPKFYAMGPGRLENGVVYLPVCLCVGVRKVYIEDEWQFVSSVYVCPFEIIDGVFFFSN